MVVLIIMVILVLITPILMARRVVAIVTGISPDKASRKQNRDCAQQDGQFQSRPI
jgi:hypothetical protein